MKKSVKEEKNKKLKKAKAVKKERVVKEKKKSSNCGSSFVLMLIILVIGILIGIFISNNVLKLKNKEFIGLYNDIKKNYYGEIKDNFDDKIISSMVSSLEDPNSGVYMGLDATNYRDTINNKFIGIGVQMVTDDNGSIIFTNVFEDGPAMKAGAKVDDKLIKVNGTDITNMSSVDVGGLIKGGKEKDIVEITVLRNNEEKTLKIEKSTIVVDTVTINYLNDDIAMISINSFVNTTVKELKDKLNEAKEKGIKKVALDLRNNSFGSISIAKDIADLFLDKGSIIYKAETKNGSKEYLANSKKEYNFDLVLVTNECTIRASEMLACALIDNLGVKVIGTGTGNNNSIHKVYETDNTVAEYTIGRWISPKGKDVKEVGINIDYIEENDINAKVIEVLNK